MKTKKYPTKKNNFTYHYRDRKGNIFLVTRAVKKTRIRKKGRSKILSSKRNAKYSREYKSAWKAYKKAEGNEKKAISRLKKATLRYFKK